MDMHVPNSSSAALGSRSSAARLLAQLAAAAPDTSADADGATQELFQALAPRDAAEAMLAVLAIAAAQSAVDNFSRAARPGLSDETVIRLRGSALAAGRSYAAALRYLRRKADRQEAPAEPAAAAEAAPPPGYVVLQPGAEPIPAIDLFQPHDRDGKPIPRWRTEEMTPAQCRASLAYPRDPKLEEAALADEARMRAEQGVRDGARPPVAPSG